MADNPAPADPNQGFPNPHAEGFAGERTPAEELEYQRQQLARDVAAGKVDPRTGEPTARPTPTRPKQADTTDESAQETTPPADV